MKREYNIKLESNRTSIHKPGSPLGILLGSVKLSNILCLVADEYTYELNPTEYSL